MSAGNGKAFGQRFELLPLRTSGNENDLPNEVWDVLVRIEIYVRHDVCMMHCELWSERTS